MPENSIKYFKYLLKKNKQKSLALNLFQNSFYKHDPLASRRDHTTTKYDKKNRHTVFRLKRESQVKPSFKEYGMLW